MNTNTSVEFPEFSFLRCLMMPYIQGEPDSLPEQYAAYSEIIRTTFLVKGDIGYLTIDESVAQAGKPHRGTRAKFARALHTEAGRRPGVIYAWGGGKWGGGIDVTLERNVEILLANNIDNSCAVWDGEHEDTSDDGDIGHASDEYPYEKCALMKAGEVHRIGILTPHESLPMKKTSRRQFLRIVSSGVHGRESYFTRNPLLDA